MTRSITRAGTHRGLRLGDVICLARAEQRIVVTHDLDFTDLLALSDATAWSVIAFRLRSMRPDRVLARLVAVLLAQRDDLEAGAIVSASETFTRVRRLPITMNPGKSR